LSKTDFLHPFSDHERAIESDRESCISRDSLILIVLDTVGIILEILYAIDKAVISLLDLNINSFNDENPNKAYGSCVIGNSKFSQDFMNISLKFQNNAERLSIRLIAMIFWKAWGK